MAIAKYERDSAVIRYLCQKTDGVQSEMFGNKEEPTFVEGAVRFVEQSEYERHPLLRALALRHHGHCCLACDFDFGQVYGDQAKGFIHVHHLTPLSEVGAAHTVNPETDLIPVCPNCHAVMHLKAPPLSLEEVRQLIATQH